MFNPIICPVRNNLHLTRKAVASFRNQDIGDVEIFIINNASTDGTVWWLNTQRDVIHMYFEPPLSVAASWNVALKHVFRMGAEYALVVNNDVELRPDTYRWLVGDGGGFVTAVGNREASKIQPVDGEYPAPEHGKTRPHPDFSCYVIRKEVYDKVGEFDECFEIAYCEDASYHVRMHRAGVPAYCLDLPFLHHGAGTIKYAEPAEVRKIQMQAEKNRMLFKKMYGFGVGSPEYYAHFGTGAPPEN